LFRHDTHHHHLPCIQTQAGGGPFHHFDATPTTTTSLMSKREPEVVFLVLPMPLPPPPPPSCPNASRRWLFSSFQHDSHYHHLPRVQTRVGGGCFRHFDAFAPPPPPSHSNASRRRSISLFRHASYHHHLPCFQTQAGGGSFCCVDATPTTTSSLASKHKLEVVLFGGFKASAAAATSSPPVNR